MATLMTTACFSPTVPTPEPDTVRTPKEYKERGDNDEDKDDVLRRARQRYSGDICEDLDRRDTEKKKCEKICKEIYDNSKERDECERQYVNLIEDLEEVYDALEDGDEDDFKGINAELFDTYLNIGISGLDDIIRDYNNSEAKDFILWLIDYDEISHIFIKEDKNHKTLLTLFKALDDGYTESVARSAKTGDIFTERIDSPYDLMELAINTGSEEIMDWFLSYINDINTDCKADTESVACFTVYCKIGKDLDDDDRNEWVDDFEVFEEYLNDIVSSEVNREAWEPTKIRTGDIETLNNVMDEQTSDNTWFDALCEGLH